MNKSDVKVEAPTPDEVAAYGGAPSPAEGASRGDAAVEGAVGPTGDLERLQAELREAQDRLLRARAETQNVTRRLNDERDLAVRYANANFARSLLAVWDNLERTLAHTRDHHESDPVIQGVRLTWELFKKVMADAGVEPIEALGKPFDPTQHEALMRQETADAPEGTVTQELEKGFRMKDRVLRAAKVAVAATPAGGANEGASERAAD